ncbi:MAG: agmatinase [Halobacteriota archaeon]
MKYSGSLSDAEREKADYEIIGVPYDGNALKKGASKGPAAIRKASQRLETFLWHQKLELSELLYYDCGDVNLESVQNQEFYTRQKIFLGGDHSISFPLFQYFFDRLEVEKVIVIDAHADFRYSYRNNNFSNACVMRRIAELAGFENVIEIGVRSASAAEYEFMKDRIRIYDAKMLAEEGALEGIVKGKTYLSIDIDVLDPGIAPGVEHPEPCGMSLESLISVVRGLMANVEVVVTDVTEVNPQLDSTNGITSINAARLVFEILACYGHNVIKNDAPI